MITKDELYSRVYDSLSELMDDESSDVIDVLARGLTDDVYAYLSEQDWEEEQLSLFPEDGDTKPTE